MDISRIQALAQSEPKSILARTVKLQEEVGELAQEVLIAEQASGSLHKEAGKDGIKGECIDVAIVAFSIFFAAGGEAQDLEALFALKCDKWEKWQSKK